MQKQSCTRVHASMRGSGVGHDTEGPGEGQELGGPGRTAAPSAGSSRCRELDRLGVDTHTPWGPSKQILSLC